MNETPRTPGECKVQDQCIYILNNNQIETNRIFACVQPGQFFDDDRQTSLAECKATAAYLALAYNHFEAVVEALKKCRTNIAGYAVYTSADYPKVLQTIINELRRIDSTARATLQAIDVKP